MSENQENRSSLVSFINELSKDLTMLGRKPKAAKRIGSLLDRAVKELRNFDQAPGELPSWFKVLEDRKRGYRKLQLAEKPTIHYVITAPCLRESSTDPVLVQFCKAQVTDADGTPRDMMFLVLDGASYMIDARALPDKAMWADFDKHQGHEGRTVYDQKSDAILLRAVPFGDNSELLDLTLAASYYDKVVQLLFVDDKRAAEFAAQRAEKAAAAKAAEIEREAQLKAGDSEQTTEE